MKTISSTMTDTQMSFLALTRLPFLGEKMMSKQKCWKLKNVAEKKVFCCECRKDFWVLTITFILWIYEHIAIAFLFVWEFLVTYRLEVEIFFFCFLLEKVLKFQITTLNFFLTFLHSPPSPPCRPFFFFQPKIKFQIGIHEIHS